ncbi:diacylglycerol kinase family protein [Arthrobacter sp. H35-D1]|uniref:diacylglycerol/lipid kinase family protein n=1 Tax=Arthrobacter sp. H35-D1 TaxID=3046202 RepID=UPI0024B9CDC2|nr:diacylglycerol kinase family protein [Arthrobacter sp. H35-D1]MDJ0313528.1 diacylglycerol kinase family protein [Arthrobacter sp. H35-D1]
MAENQPRQGKRAAVVINPVKSPDKQFKATITQVCTDAGWEEPLWLETSKDDPGHGQAKEALEAGVDVVIAAGGDGTIRAVAEVLAGTDTAMGLLPLGTGNLLARNLGIDVASPVRAARGVLEGTESRIDVVKVVVDHAEQEQMFLVAAGLGYDASIMANTVDGLKDRVGWLAYVESGLRNLPGKPVTATITVDGKQEKHRKVRGVMVGNCGKLMGGLEIFPNAVVTDGILDLLTFSPHGRFGWLGVVVGVFGKGKSRSVRSLSGRTAEISLDSPQEFQIDGDHLGSASHLRVTVDPLALTILMTASPGRDELTEEAMRNENAPAPLDAE